jgi:RimJ/RimL family protein N-acetyltransferase
MIDTETLPLMRLEPYTDADAWLTRALETDLEVMRHLGGPWPQEAIAGIHERRLAATADGAWVRTVVVDPGPRRVGTVSLWLSEWQGQPVSEAGWMILPDFQGLGYGRAAVRLLLDLARADGRWGPIDASPAVGNGASNAICQASGFELLGEVDVEYGGRALRGNHWRAL